MPSAMSTMDRSEPSAHTKGTTVRSSAGTASTRTLARPVSGIRRVTPSAGSSWLAGSTSTTNSNPGCMTEPGISVFADFLSAPSASSTPVGIGVSEPGISAT